MSAAAPRRTARALIRHCEPEDAQTLLRFRCENRAHLASWEPLREESYFTLDQCAGAIAASAAAAAQDRAYGFAVLDHDAGRMLATVTFSNVVRGPFQACLLGYGVDARYQGQGLMHEVLATLVPWAFDELGLHRVMANYHPRNVRSSRLLQRLGFEREGYARQYLQIAGVWEDHVLTAKISGARDSKRNL